MKLKHVFSAFALSSLCAHGTVVSEVAFLLQGNQLSWFDLANPDVNGFVDIGLPGSFSGNALAYDSDRNRLLFTTGNASQNQTLYAVDLTGMILSPGMSVAGSATSVGNFSFTNPQELLGGEFYNGAYYVLRNGSDTLVRMAFDGSGSVSSQTPINLPGNATMFLGDLAFDGDGNLVISGYNGNGSSNSDDRLWSFSTTDGENFSFEGVVNPDGNRFNGIGYSIDGELFGYRTTAQSFGTIDPASGDYAAIYHGTFFDGSGDLSSGVAMPIEAVPEPSVSLLAGAAGVLLASRRRRRA